MAEWCGELGFLLNGREISVSGIAPQTTLLDFVRGRGLTGAKEGCAEGECGACAVLLVEAREGKAVYRAVNSCLIPLPGMAGREVITVEGLAEGGTLAEAQSAMIRFGGSQCGYCTPGFVVSMYAEQHNGDARDAHALGGNLCRCTGYRPIAEAFRSLGPVVARKREAARLERLNYVAGAGRFSRPGDLAECLEAGSDARFVAGNTDLGVETNLRQRRFPHLVSVEGLEELRGFADGPERVEIGAGLTLTEIAEHWTSAPPVFREWLRLFASPLIRNRATLGGNLATASPIGDGAPLLLALDAEVVIASAAGERVVPLDEFFVAYRKTALGPGELIRAVRIPKPFAGLVRFYKVAKRRLDDISTVAAGIALTRDEAGVIVKARLAYGGVAAIPWRAREVEEALLGTRGGDVTRAKALLAGALKPISDHRGSAAYRLAMAGNLLEKSLAT